MLILVYFVLFLIIVVLSPLELLECRRTPCKLNSSFLSIRFVIESLTEQPEHLDQQSIQKDEQK